MGIAMFLTENRIGQTAAMLLFAVALDLIFGDPKNFPHPVVYIGKMIEKGEKLLRPLFSDTKGGQFTGGMVLSLFVVSSSFFAPLFLLFLLGMIHPLLRFAAEVFFAYQILAIKSLRQESMKVYDALINENLFDARTKLSYIVGRDTKDLDEADVIKGAVETVAENTCDGVIAPMLFLVLGGVPLGFLYKAVNTLDSMIGYHNDRYEYFGKFAARLDDVLNFIPARLSALLMICAAAICRLDAKEAVRVYFRDRKKHKSPNSGQTEAACAGALGVQLGGDAYYFGILVSKETIGDPYNVPAPRHIKEANRLMIGTTAAFLVVYVLITGFFAL